MYYLTKNVNNTFAIETIVNALKKNGFLKNPIVLYYSDSRQVYIYKNSFSLTKILYENKKPIRIQSFLKDEKKLMPLNDEKTHQMLNKKIRYNAIINELESKSFLSK